MTLNNSTIRIWEEVRNRVKSASCLEVRHSLLGEEYNEKEGKAAQDFLE